MSQNSQRPKPKIEPRLESVIQVKLPIVRDFSTGGGHGPEETLVEGDEKIVTQKWQGYPPQNLKVLGKPNPPLSYVALPRFTGKAEYTTRVLFPNMLHAKILTSPHPRARIKSIDVSRAEKIPGVAYVLTYRNSPSTYPMPQELDFFGEIVAIVAADTEDLAEDAVEAISVDYEVLPFASTLRQVMAPGAPDLRKGKGNLMLQNPRSSEYTADATALMQFGNIDKGFAEADIVKEFEYYFAGAVPVPMQPAGSVAKWDGDKLTFWGMGQAIHPLRDDIAEGLGIDSAKVRYINKWNGCTLGGAQRTSRPNPWIAYIAKQTGRPVRLMLPKDQELSFMQVKPENITKFKVGVKKDGRIIALVHEVHFSAGVTEGAGMAGLGSTRSHLMLYGSKIPNWKSVGYNYKTNSLQTGASRSNQQQERKWSWENMMDEMADAVGMDPIQFRLLHISQPGTKLPRRWAGLDERPESVDGQFIYSDSFASVEVLQEGAKAIGWDRRNPRAGGNPGRFKRGMGMSMSQHHAGSMGYHEGEIGFEKIATGGRGGGGPREMFTATVELNMDGTITARNAQPESGTNHDTAMATMIAEMLGFTNLDRMRMIWGDSDLTPASAGWHSGRTTMLQGGALCNAVDKLRKDLLRRASETLKVDAARLQIVDGVISSKDDPKKRVTFGDLARANKAVISETGRCVSGRTFTAGIGAVFVEVEVDTWTGDWKFIRSVYSTDTGLVINPLLAEADMHGSFVQSAQMTTDTLPWDREFSGTRHYAVGYLSFRIPTIMDVAEQTNVFIDSLEPRWFFGTKGIAETTIGGVPGAISNAIYNACGVRVREHPITREKIMAGLKGKL
jgi:xanthine dehydrogenase YagR molybdenum-binding subunit